MKSKWIVVLVDPTKSDSFPNTVGQSGNLFHGDNGWDPICALIRFE